MYSSLLIKKYLILKLYKTYYILYITIFLHIIMKIIFFNYFKYILYQYLDMFAYHLKHLKNMQTISLFCILSLDNTMVVTFVLKCINVPNSIRSNHFGSRSKLD